MDDLIDSVGTLYAAQDLFDDIQSRAIHKEPFLRGFRTYGTSTAKAVLNLTTKLSWVAVADSGQLVSTPSGAIAHRGSERHLRLRHQLQSAIENFKPPWAAIMAKGRCEAENTLPPTIKQCFKEARLFDCPPEEIIDWWDILAGIMREQSGREKLEIGRRGERLSLDFERERTGQHPKWMAVETNFAGYDVLSVREKKSDAQLRIEVKASTRRFRDAAFHVTKHEWATANIPHSEYIFHFWLLDQEPPVLHIVSRENIAEHIPDNSGKGQWTGTEIPLGSVTHPSKGIYPPHV